MDGCGLGFVVVWGLGLDNCVIWFDSVGLGVVDG